MASLRDGGSEFIGGNHSADNSRRKFIDAPMEAVQQPALDSFMELAGLFSILPQAFIASQKRELERVTATGKEDDPRRSVIQASIDRAVAIQATAQLGKARFQRAVDALNDKAYVFHGFVYDEGLVSQSGLVVRLIDAGQTSKGQTLEAITSSDGYFRIKLGVKGGTSGAPQPINDLFMGSTGTKLPKSDTSTAEAQVEILRKEKVIYADSDPVPLDQGTAYREYVIPSDEQPASQ